LVLKKKKGSPEKANPQEMESSQNKLLFGSLAIMTLVRF
jgi:hypothetical protein